MAKTDKERLVTGFWNRIESNQATDCNRVDRDNESKMSSEIAESILSCEDCVGM